ncbi:hypothetical protein HY68_36625 [Streptomyces sp. AcH 505]|uniref:hypothetical protein n=1 Tax=Streptomyces sp. AcH 505 TaxID=352211 RepID=UPI000591D3E3|nr:hypothetical protein HY68_36625 [Streptomyces sp. AcH 505]
MSLALVVRCDRSGPHGMCGQFLPTGTADETQAYALAEQQGWDVGGDSADFCPGHAHRPKPDAQPTRIHHTIRPLTALTPEEN